MRNILLIIAAAMTLGIITYLGGVINLWPWTHYYLINAGFLVFLTIISDQINLQAIGQQGRAVIIPYLISTILKLVLSAIFLILFVRAHFEMAREIVFGFLAYYAVFSVTEIIIVNSRTRAKNF